MYSYWPLQVLHFEWLFFCEIDDKKPSCSINLCFGGKQGYQSFKQF